jgi:hypothetical protein
MDSGRAPPRVRRRHLADEDADLPIDAWTAVPSGSRTSGPSAAELLAMRSHDGLRLHEHHGRAPVPPGSGQDDPKQAVARLEMRTKGRAFHRRQLLPQRQVLQDQFPMSAERQGQRLPITRSSSSVRRSCVAPVPKSTGTSSGEGQALDHVSTPCGMTRRNASRSGLAYQLELSQ